MIVAFISNMSCIVICQETLPKNFNKLSFPKTLTYFHSCPNHAPKLQPQYQPNSSLSANQHATQFTIIPATIGHISTQFPRSLVINSHPNLKKTSLNMFRHYKLKPSFPIIKDNKTKDRVGQGGVGDKPLPQILVNQLILI